MNSPAQDVSTLLVAASLSLTLGTNLFCFEEPDSPDACVTIYDTGGAEPHPTYVYLKPTIQVRVRGAQMGSKWTAAYTLAEGIRDALHGVNNQTVGGTKYIQIFAQGDMFSLGADDNNRPVLTINFEIHRGVV